MPMIAMEPGSIRGLHLVVKDIAGSREELTDRGLDVGEIDDERQGVKYAAFRDPEGNRDAAGNGVEISRLVVT